MEVRDHRRSRGGTNLAHVSLKDPLKFCDLDPLFPVAKPLARIMLWFLTKRHDHVAASEVFRIKIE